MSGYRSSTSVAALAATLWLASGCGSAVTSQQIPVLFPSPTTLTGDVYKPAGDGPFPALVLLHGCSGIQPNTIQWALWLRSQGYVALVLDSFSGRGLRRLCADSTPLTGGSRAFDVYAGARYLKTLPFVDGQRLGAIGWSHGGWTVLRASLADGVYPDLKLRGFVAFYPYCGDMGVCRSSTPLLMLLGARDDWTPAEPCRALADAARRDGLDVTAVVYPEGHHGFDSAHVRQRTTIPDARRGQGATVEYNPQAHADAEKQLKEFLEARLKR